MLWEWIEAFPKEHFSVVLRVHLAQLKADLLGCDVQDPDVCLVGAACPPGSERLADQTLFGREAFPHSWESIILASVRNVHPLALKCWMVYP